MTRGYIVLTQDFELLLKNKYSPVVLIKKHFLARFKEIMQFSYLTFLRIAVTAEMVEPFLDGMTLDEALEKRRIFVVDLEVLDKLECNMQRVVCLKYFSISYLLNLGFHVKPVQYLRTPKRQKP